MKRLTWPFDSSDHIYRTINFDGVFMDFPTKVVASVTSLEEAKEALELGADIIEIRVDLAPGDPLALVESIYRLNHPIIVTIRPTWEGGAFTGNGRRKG